MPAHHEPFAALAPIDWDSVTVEEDSLKELFKGTFSKAQILIDSIPPPANASKSAAASGRARSHTDSAVPLGQLATGHRQNAEAIKTAEALRKEWKEVKVNPRDNPLAINVYKLAAKDGKGSWFARRSVHEGLTFERWKLGLESEFAEALKVESTEPGAGKIRGIGAEKKAEHEVVPGEGKLEVYQLSARFPGPTTPRDFVTLLVTDQESHHDTKTLRPRQYMIISKPCIHPDCPPRQGYIRGQYESVELIREVPIGKPLRRTRSSIDIGNDRTTPAETTEDVGKEARIRSSRVAGDVNDDDAKSETNAGRRAASATGEDIEEPEMAIEWLMVTRSDPGGSVPRFMVEKGTPAGIVGDAGRLLNWINAKDPRDIETDGDSTTKEHAVKVEEKKDGISKEMRKPVREGPTANLVPVPEAKDPEAEMNPGGFYGMIAGALGAAGSMVASRVPNPFTGSQRATDSEPDIEPDEDVSSDDSSSFHSFESAPEPPPAEQADAASPDTVPVDLVSTHSTRSAESDTAPAGPASLSQHEKDLRKLQDRRRKAQEKLERMQERAVAKRNEDKEKDASALSKLTERHEREIAKQEEKYQKELKKLEDRRTADERKAEARRKKAIEREEKSNLAVELDKVRAERDIAQKERDILKQQVGDLQAQNTMLVAKLGKLGISQEDARNDFIRKGDKTPLGRTMSFSSKSGRSSKSQ